MWVRETRRYGLSDSREGNRGKEVAEKVRERGREKKWETRAVQALNIERGSERYEDFLRKRTGEPRHEASEHDNDEIQDDEYDARENEMQLPNIRIRKD